VRDVLAGQHLREVFLEVQGGKFLGHELALGDLLDQLQLWFVVVPGQVAEGLD
jgi:hypothetical protein